jgi:hypothetical protein
LKPILRIRARALWSSSSLFTITKKKKHQEEEVILSSSIDEVYTVLPNITFTTKNLIDSIAECLVKRKLGDVLGKWFVREVISGSSSSTKDKEEVVVVEDVDSVLEAAKRIGGEVGLLAKNVERVQAAVSERLDFTTTGTTVPVGWKAVVSGDKAEEEEEESDGSDDGSSSLSLSSINSFDEDEDEEEDDIRDYDEESQVPSTILRALVLYRSLFSSSSSKSMSTSTNSTTTSGLFPPPMISIEPPTPTMLLTPVRRRTATATSSDINITVTTTKSSFFSSARSATTSTSTSTSITGVTSAEQRKKMYALRKILGSRVFELRGEVMEDARDRVVDMLVDAERKGVCCARV